VDWSTLACGRSDHVTFAPDEPELAAQMGARLPAGEAWQCLRCGAYVPGPPVLSGPAATAPVVPRAREIRSRLILRVFAVERFVRGILAGAAAVFLWQFRHSRVSVEQRFDRELPVVRGLFRQLGFNISNSKLVGLLHHALTLSTKTLSLVALGLAVYAVIELVEAVGLWLARRWGEYFAALATSLGLPLEIYDLAKKITVTALVLFAINLALVLYLVITKRLFGVRGGKRAYDARLWSESVLEAAEKAAAQQAAADPRTAPLTGGLAAVSTPADPAPADPATADPATANTAPADPAADDTAPADPAADDTAPADAAPTATAGVAATVAAGAAVATPAAVAAASTTSAVRTAPAGPSATAERSPGGLDQP
jgi:uncharacterized membrane protein (DUF2068 family)